MSDALTFDGAATLRLPLIDKKDAALVATPAGQRWYNEYTEWLNRPENILLSKDELWAAAVAAGYLAPPTNPSEKPGIAIPH